MTVAAYRDHLDEDEQIRLAAIDLQLADLREAMTRLYREKDGLMKLGNQRRQKAIRRGV